MSEHFAHKKPGHCSDCGVNLGGRFYTQRFVMSNGSTIDASMCLECAKLPWTRERLDALKAQMNDAYKKAVHGVFYGKVNGVWGLVPSGAPWPEDRAQRELVGFCPLTLVRPVGNVELNNLITSTVVTHLSPTAA